METGQVFRVGKARRCLLACSEARLRRAADAGLKSHRQPSTASILDVDSNLTTEPTLIDLNCLLPQDASASNTTTLAQGASHEHFE